MLELRPNCECCDRDLALDDPNVFICTMECTWCGDCARDLADTCPNCGGGLTPRPIRPASWLARYPASTTRVFAPDCRERLTASRA
ncbi:MAG: DUF1272 domain-containing protein [Microbacterium sp.]|uniref:DUF1272 domain-containing protein n=1 Tax=Microbacterium sp. TaxID=51671 RepID=UPI002634A27C|nr:DUF1272 domain-containing protein [Microbacterium sp.]MCX6501270.1 DUF1272 domain-containing protein [Microbacterium sp.]